MSKTQTGLLGRVTGLAAVGLFAFGLTLSTAAAQPVTACTQEATDLIAGKSSNVGNVNVCKDKSTLTVTYAPSSGWCLLQTNLQVAAGLDGIPQTNKGSPKPDLFDDGDDYDCATSASFKIPLADIGDGAEPGDLLTIAANATVEEEATGKQAGAWGGGTRFVEKGNWATYFTYVVPRFVFVTSQAFNSNLGGVAGADAKCQDAAEGAGLPGSYKAWIADSTVSSAPASPERGFTQSTAPYVLPSGTSSDSGAKVADDWADLITCTPIGSPFAVCLDHGINVDEFGEDVFSFVWTNVARNGTKQSDAACYNWLEGPDGAEGRNGATGEVDGKWTYYTEPYCEAVGGLYCFEQ